MRLATRMTASPIRRMGTSVEDGCRESSRAAGNHAAVHAWAPCWGEVRPRGWTRVLPGEGGESQEKESGRDYVSLPRPGTLHCAGIHTTWNHFSVDFPYTACFRPRISSSQDNGHYGTL